MVFTRASQPMMTRSKGQARDDKIHLAELPKKRKANTRDAGSQINSKRVQTLDTAVQDARGGGLSKRASRTSLKDKTYPISCPEIGCDCSLDPEVDIKPVFTTKKDVKEYGELLDVAAISCIPKKDRFYCPNPACSALYDFTDHTVPARCKDVSRACHSCSHKFCMRCQVAWHDSLSCTAFQALPAEERSSSADIQIHALAKTENWKRCPSCRYFVERLEGCAFMACHCGCNFDFNTGQPYENGIGPAHLFAPEWVDDHLAMMAANLAQLEALAAGHH
ncbi:MAG: E3 ubiquitin-ligase [Trebouxia sp. A1-2]|nr:MAG: E3 ubiquitin-ligase [Trebouxia sp. A1-2]